MSIKANFKENMITLISEFLGTGLLTMVYASGVVNADAIIFVFAIMSIISFGAKFSGALYNPAITAGYFFYESEITLSKPMVICICWPSSLEESAELYLPGLSPRTHSLDSGTLEAGTTSATFCSSYSDLSC